MPAGGVDIKLGVTGHGAGVGRGTGRLHSTAILSLHVVVTLALKNVVLAQASLTEQLICIEQKHRHGSKGRFAHSRTRHSVSSRARPVNFF